MQFRSEQRNALLIVAYFCAIVSGAALAYFGAAWAFGALGYPLPAPLPDDAFEPVLFVLGLVFATSSWAIARLRQDPTAPAHAPSLPHAIAPDLRAELLKSQMTRITYRLHDTLGEQARLELGLTTIPASVAPRWRWHLGVVEQATPQPLTPAPLDSTPIYEAPITRAFDRFNGQLLILGDPGAGKTTLLLELARDLIARAQADATHPIPVLVNLSMWGSNPRPLEQWLVEAMRDAVGTSKRFAQQLIAGDQVLPLLDGLDEVAPTQRAACVQAINAFLAERMQQRVAVCCRMQEYEVIGEQLAFEEALQVEPLTKQQIADVLQAGGTKLAGVRQALHDEARFRDVLTTPLMLNIVILAYSGVAAVQLAGQTPQELLRHLFAAYVERMLTRHNERLDARYRPHVQHWLAWLAHQMRRENTTDFRVGDMQPTMLKHQLLYRILVGLVGGLGFGLISGLGFGLISGLGFGLGGGLIGGLGFGLLIGQSNTIMLEDRLNWSLKHAIEETKKEWLMFGMIGVLFGGLVFGPQGGLLGGIVSLIFFGLLSGRKRADVIDLSPNDSLSRSLQSGFLVGLFGVMIGTLFGALIGNLASGIGFGLFLALIGGLSFGWVAVIQHYTLRFALWREGVIPLNYVRFLCQSLRGKQKQECIRGVIPLNYVRFLGQCHDALLLQRDGGIFRFRHSLLQNYFADMWEGVGKRDEID